MMDRRVFLALAGALPLSIAAGPAAAKPPVFQSSGIAINGYDPVAYFTEGKPVKGAEAFAVQHDGATFRFASAENKAVFEANPAKYAPQYGGYCAWAVSRNYTAKTDPDAWSIENGKLYLNFSKRIRSRWLKDVPGNIAAGDANWPGVLN